MGSVLQRVQHFSLIWTGKMIFWGLSMTMQLSLLKAAMRKLKMEIIMWGPRKLVRKIDLGRGSKDKSYSVPIAGVPAFELLHNVCFYQHDTQLLLTVLRN